MSGKTPKLPVDELPIEDEEIATNQDAIPVPFLCGTRKIALRWLGPATGLITKQSANQRPGKK